MVVYVNGSFLSEEEAKVSVFDHGFLYGDGVFEGLKAYNGRIFALDEHVDRFFESAQSIQLTLPLSRIEMKKAILETVRRNNLKDAYIRPVASRGKGALGLDPRSCKKATVVIIVDAEIRHPEDTGGTSLSHKGFRSMCAQDLEIPSAVLAQYLLERSWLSRVSALTGNGI